MVLLNGLISEDISDRINGHALWSYDMSMTNQPVEVLTLVTLCDSEWVKSHYTAVTITLIGSLYYKAYLPTIFVHVCAEFFC